MNKVFGVGIVGAGDILYDHAMSLASMRSRARFIGLADLDESRLKIASSKYFVPYLYSDYNELIARNDIDIITVATPPSTHEKIVIDALTAGKHVVCEKPLAHTMESADRIIEAAEKSAGKLTVCYQVRYMEAIKRMIWLRDNGWLGKLQYGNFERMTPISGIDPGSWWGKWDVAGGGAVMTQFIHQLDVMICLFGKPVSVSAEMDTFKQDIESEDTFAAIIRFESGALVSCSGSLNSFRLKTGFDIIADRASVHLPWTFSTNDSKYSREISEAMIEADLLPQDQKPGRLRPIIKKLTNQFTGDGIPVKIMRKIFQKLGIKTFIGTPPLHKDLLMDFMDAIENDSAVPVSLQDARKSLELCTAMYESAITGKKVKLPITLTNLFYKGISGDVYKKKNKEKDE